MPGTPPVDAPSRWAFADRTLDLGRPRIMAIVNVTPDSFSDGGELLGPAGVDVPRIVEHCATLCRYGADIVDVGGESTRPGSAEVSVDEERARVEPVIAGLSAAGVPAPISVDTRRAAVARAALEAGATIVNDVSGLADPDMVSVVAGARAGLVIGHLRGEPSTMQQNIRFADLLGEVTAELAQAVDAAVAAGVDRSRILVDPGIGFGKSAEQSAALVAAAGWLREATGCPVLVGASRKSFLGVLGSPADPRVAGPKGRLPGSLAAALVAVERGASVLRVHDVPETAQALAVAAGIRSAFERLATPGGVQ